MALTYLDLRPGEELVDYRQAWDRQRAVHAEVSCGAREDTVILLEHASVYTAGKRTEPHERPLDGTPVIDVDRGGKITWHGPGQLVGYPIVKLPDSVGVVDYVRRLEEALIRAFAGYGVSCGRVPGRSGVWLATEPATDATPGRPERKIAAIGVRVAAGATMHGFAANIDPDLAWFAKIIPCGISDAGVTSLAAEIDHAPTLSQFAGQLRPHLDELLAFEPYQKAPDLPDSSSQPVVSYGLAVAR
jgi:lipoyl(octanoyl) transferase